MKREFDFQLDAKKFLPLFLGFFIPWLILEVLIAVQSSGAEAGTASTASVFTLLLPVAAVILLTVLFRSCANSSRRSPSKTRRLPCKDRSESSWA